MADIEIRPVGRRGLLIELADLDAVAAWRAQLSGSPLDGQVDAVAAARSVLLTFDAPAAAHAARDTIQGLEPGPPDQSEARVIDVPVVYDGEDLAEVADELDLSEEALVEWHSGTQWTAAFGGFAPGFAYCAPADADQARSVARLESPRTAVPAGAVGLAGEFSAIYPRTSPGGWRLIGSTDVALWDASSDRPALIAPGDTVRYRPVREAARLSSSEEDAAGEAAGTGPGDAGEAQAKPAPAPAAGARLPRRPLARLEDAGLLSLLQDLGRAGHGDLGVTGSGAADRAAAAAANDAVGNPASAAVVENIGGLSLTALADAVVAVAGAPGPLTVETPNGARRCQPAAPILLPAGARLTVAPPERGQRRYLSLRGGILADGEELGSLSSDQLSGLGPKPLAAGDVLSGAPSRAPRPARAATNPFSLGREGGRDRATLRAVPGPRDDWFAGGAEQLAVRDFTVTPDSNRVGLRLDSGGAPLKRTRSGELKSEGIAAGAIQVPPSGEPVVFLRDHAVTGGYPVIATVLEEDLDLAAQLSPGSLVDFRLVDP